MRSCLELYLRCRLKVSKIAFRGIFKTMPRALVQMMTKSLFNMIFRLLCKIITRAPVEIMYRALFKMTDYRSLK